MKMRSLNALTCVACLFLAVAPGWSQTPTTGQIAGQIVDPSEAVVPGASLLLTSETVAQRETSSDGAGRFRFPLLPPGVYRLEAETGGFSTVTIEQIVVRITETTAVDVELQVAAQETRLVVTAETPLVDFESAARGEVIQQDTLRQLPLATRNFQQLLTLTPGTSSALSNAGELGRGDNVVSVNGQRTVSNSLVINGVDANALASGSLSNLAVPTIDSLQEFIVQTSLHDATQGRASGGVVAVVTKSGTPEYHGNLFYFLRNDAFNANNFFLNAQGTEKPVYDRDQFGGTLGGPVVKDRAWFFLSYQGTREDNGTSLDNSLATVFVPGNLTDDRSDGALAALSTSFGLGGRVHPTAAALLRATLPNGALVIPSAPSPTGLPDPVRVTIPAVSSFHEEQFNANLDLQITQANRVSAKFFHADNDFVQALFDSFGAGNPLQLPGFASNSNFKQPVVSVHDTHIFGPGLLNAFRFGFNRISTQAVPEQPFTAAEFGIRSPLSSLFPEMPTISIANFMDIGPSFLQDNDAQFSTYTLGDMLTWTKGRHTLKFGAGYNRHLLDIRFDVFTRGQVTHLGFIRDARGRPNPFNDFLAGLASLATIGSGVNERAMRSNDFNWFVQHDWRVTNRLALNLGLRYEYYGPFHELAGRFVGFDPDLATTVPIPGSGVAVTGGFVQAGNARTPLPGIPMIRDSLVEPDRNNFAPRFGFAFQPFPNTDRLVVRGGYGIYYNPPSARPFLNQLFNFPYAVQAVAIAAPITDPFAQVPLPSAFPLDVTDQSLFPFGGPPVFLPAAVRGGEVAVPAGGQFPDLHNFRAAYVQQYNLGIQYEFARTHLLDVSYVGSSGRKLARLRNLNQGNFAGDLFARTGNGGPFAPGLSDLPFSRGAQLLQSSANSSYNSLQVQLSQRYSRGLQFLLGYTYSHSLDDYSGNASGTSDNSVVPGDGVLLDNRASSDFDRRHRVVLSSIYDLPQLYGGGSKAAQLVLNDWQVAGILTFQSGTPFSVLTNANASIQARADFVSGCTADDAVLGGGVTARLDQFFDTSCFTSAVGGFGNTGRNILRGPDQRNVDFSLIKFFPIDETRKLEFRAEFFNITNTPSFANPVNIAQSGNFGQVVSTSSGSRIIQLALKFSF